MPDSEPVLTKTSSSRSLTGRTVRNSVEKRSSKSIELNPEEQVENEDEIVENEEPPIPEEPPFSYIQMLDEQTTIELEEPVDITFDVLKQISQELGLIKLCWPELTYVTFEDRSNFPESYLKNTNKEQVLLLYAENFRKQYVHMFPDKKPLLLACDNECGLQKMVCTTIRPTTLPYAELYEWQECARFVADHLKYEIFDEPTLIVRSMEFNGTGQYDYLTAPVQLRCALRQQMENAINNLTMTGESIATRRRL